MDRILIGERKYAFTVRRANAREFRFKHGGVHILFNWTKKCFPRGRPVYVYRNKQNALTARRRCILLASPCRRYWRQVQFARLRGA